MAKNFIIVLLRNMVQSSAKMYKHIFLVVTIIYWIKRIIPNLKKQERMFDKCPSVVGNAAKWAAEILINDVDILNKHGGNK